MTKTWTLSPSRCADGALEIGFSRDKNRRGKGLERKASFAAEEPSHCLSPEAASQKKQPPSEVKDVQCVKCGSVEFSDCDGLSQDSSRIPVALKLQSGITYLAQATTWIDPELFDGPGYVSVCVCLCKKETTEQPSLTSSCSSYIFLKGESDQVPNGPTCRYGESKFAAPTAPALTVFESASGLKTSKTNRIGAGILGWSAVTMGSGLLASMIEPKGPPGGQGRPLLNQDSLSRRLERRDLRLDHRASFCRGRSLCRAS